MRPPPLARRTLLGWVTLLVFAACSSPKDLDLESLSIGSYDTVAEEYRRSYLFFHPEVASRRGWEGYDDRIPDRSAEAVSDQIGRLQELLLRLRRLPRAFLDQPRWVEWHWLEGQVRSDLWVLDIQSRAERDPLFYLEPQVRGLQALLERRGDPLDEPRLRALTARLEALPAQLESGGERVTAPETWRSRRARAVARAAAEYLGRDIGAILDRMAERPSLTDWHDRLARARHAALAALEEYADLLDRVALPRAKPGQAIGSQSLRRRLAYELLIEDPLDDLLEAATQEALASREALLPKFGEGPVEAARWPELTGGARPEDRDEAAWIEQARLEAEALGARLDDALPEVEDVTPQMRPALAWEDGLELRAELTGFETSEWRQAIWVRPRPEVVSWGRGDWVLELLREGPRGRLLVWSAISELEDPLRRARPSPAVLEGWGGFLMRLLVDRLEMPLEPELETAWQRRRLLVSTRVVAAVRLHTGTMSLAEAREFLRRQAILTEGQAAREVDRIVGDPIGAMGFVLERQLHDLYRAAERNQGLDFRPAELTRELLSHGSLPIACLRQLLLPGDPGRERD